ncbi:uncharacterized protein JCM6883_006954 [Sporobolomyces salmoneus]|uniref:uncharacterized protein n=1 Tax=Sporobolomyces salmoneus TaxID=183962 RepID=UPI00317A4D0E
MPVSTRRGTESSPNKIEIEPTERKYLIVIKRTDLRFEPDVRIRVKSTTNAGKIYEYVARNSDLYDIDKRFETANFRLLCNGERVGFNDTPASVRPVSTFFSRFESRVAESHQLEFLPVQLDMENNDSINVMTGMHGGGLRRRLF